MKHFRLLITGGGTAGHITPGLAVIEAVKKRAPATRFLWVGVKGRREEDIVPRHGISLQTLSLRGLERSWRVSAMAKNMRTLAAWSLMIPVLKARRIIRSFEPDIVLGTGGYVCAPVLLAAHLMGIHTWVLEQNSVPGLTVKLAARFVDTVGIAYESSRRLLPDNAPVEMFGNPVLESLMSAQRSDGIREYGLDPGLKTLLVIGGSLGSKVLNDAVLELLRLDIDGKAYPGWQILHSVGAGKFEKFMRQIETPPPRYYPHAFLYHPGAALAAADLVICRGGAMTLAEVTARGVPAVIVPWPGAVRNHQHTNARALSDSGAALMIDESKLNGYEIATLLKEFSKHPERLRRMRQRAAKLGRSDAADRIAQRLLKGFIE